MRTRGGRAVLLSSRIIVGRVAKTAMEFRGVFIACLQKSSEDEDIQQKSRAVSLLTPEQYRVTREDGTERLFQNE